MAAGAETVLVRGRGGSTAPVCAEWMCVLGIDQLGQSGTVSFIPEIGCLWRSSWSSMSTM